MALLGEKFIPVASTHAQRFPDTAFLPRNLASPLTVGQGVGQGPSGCNPLPTEQDSTVAES